MKLKSFDYDLPKKFIAQKPLPKRDHSRLMVLEKATGNIRHDYFYNIGNYLRENDCLIVNESKVIKCRLFGIKEKTGAKIECFVLRKIKGYKYLSLLKPSKRLKEGSKVIIGKYSFVVIEKKDYGRAVVEFSSDPNIIFEEKGIVPLPPYIKEDDVDGKLYQTVYARRKGSVAAPTAGLHFTEELIKRLEDKGIIFAKVVLDIGIDTFRPVKEENIEEHKMHSEYYSVTAEETKKIENAKKNGGRIIAVGTTVTRVLETLMKEYDRLRPSSGSTNLYIYPGYKFKIVETMITNFHLPKSTLIIMVSAFAGRENILKSYEAAKDNNYRFFSFGDCMFIH